MWWWGAEGEGGGSNCILWETDRQTGRQAGRQRRAFVFPRVTEAAGVCCPTSGMPVHVRNAQVAGVAAAAAVEAGGGGGGGDGSLTRVH